MYHHRIRGIQVGRNFGWDGLPTNTLSPLDHCIPNDGATSTVFVNEKTSLRAQALDSKRSECKQNSIKVRLHQSINSLIVPRYIR